MSGKIATALMDRVQKRLVKSDDGCLLWTGAKTPAGYGVIGQGHTTLLYTHRVAYAFHKGTIPPGSQPPVVTPPNPDDMITQVNGAQFVSGADGTTIITLMDKDGNSMIGNDLIQIEKEIRPIVNANWVWNKISGILTLINGETVDNGQTLFYLYSKIV